MSPPGTALDAFFLLLARDATSWGRAKAAAFDALCELSPGASGPTASATLAMLRGRHDARIPAEWRTAFVEVGHQWLGFVQSRGDGGDAAPEDEKPGRWSLAWWLAPARPMRRRRVLGAFLASRLTLVLLLIAVALASRRRDEGASPVLQTGPARSRARGRMQTCARRWTTTSGCSERKDARRALLAGGK